MPFPEVLEQARRRREVAERMCRHWMRPLQAVQQMCRHWMTLPEVVEQARRHRQVAEQLCHRWMPLLEAARGTAEVSPLEAAQAVRWPPRHPLKRSAS